MPSLADRSLTAFLRTSFQILRREHAGAFGAMTDALGYGRLYLQVDEEAVVLRFGRGTPQVWSAQPRDRRPPAVVTSRRAILRLADGELTILDAVRGGDPVIVASPDDLMRLERGLGFYLRGAVRCPSFPALLEQFRDTVDSPSGGGHAHPDSR
jgi:hypothetical protein